MPPAPLIRQVSPARPLENRGELQEARKVSQESRERALRQLCMEYAMKAAEVSGTVQGGVDGLLADAEKFYVFLSGPRPDPNA